VFRLLLVVDVDFGQALAGFYQLAENFNFFNHRGHRGHSDKRSAGEFATAVGGVA
jgi:hypothetical protein